MPGLLSVNVGLPRDVTWNGKTVRTSVWKSPVDGRRMVRTLNIQGDAQADTGGSRRGAPRRIRLPDGFLSLLGALFWAATILLSASLEKISLSRDFLIARSASAIGTASVVLNLK